MSEPRRDPQTPAELRAQAETVVPGLRSIEAAIGHSFADPHLLVQAMTHAGYRAERRECGVDNQRLEFLGDAVLGAAIAELLVRALPAAREGDLTRMRAQLVMESSLAERASALGLGEHVRLGRGELACGGRQRPSILSDLFEAVLGAVFLDAGYERALAVVDAQFDSHIDELRRSPAPARDAKSQLNELLQARHRTTPRYRIVAQEGPGHSMTFVAEVDLGPEAALGVFVGRGRSKQSAEQAAAAAACEALLTSWVSP